jgi:hypothetical protein
VEGAKIGRANGVFAELDCQYGSGVSERLTSLVEEPPDLRWALSQEWDRARAMGRLP